MAISAAWGCDDLAIDLSSVIKHILRCKDVAPSSIGVVAFSLAAGISVLANSRHVDAYAFWSPAVYTDRDMGPRYRTPEIESQIVQQGWFSKGTLQVGRRFFDELNSRRIESSLNRFHHPALIVHGKGDDRIPFTSSEELVRCLPKSSKLQLIPGSDDSFRSQELYREWLFSATVAWFNERLRKTAAPSSQTSLFRSESHHNEASHFSPM